MRLAISILALALLAGPLHLLAAAPVYVILWFDTEDYLLPASDDAAKRLAELLSERGVRGTFKLVGEKARVLEKRGRTDVIAALRRHDIGYHSDFHSVHPCPSEYLAHAGFVDGIAEFARREKAGAADVRRILGVDTLSCYGQPGSSWAAQTLAALPEIGVLPHGVPCYVDEGSHIGLRDQPFWYENAIVSFRLRGNYTRMDLHNPAAVEPALEKFSAIARRLAGQGGGLVSIVYHPCEWVHQEFWDGVNFRRGANPPRSQWKAPGQLPPAETDGAFARFARYVDHMRSIPEVRFVTATDLPILYADPVRKEGCRPAELQELASRIVAANGKLNFIELNAKDFSVSEQFELLLQAAEASGGATAPKLTGLFGPESATPDSPRPAIDADEFAAAVRDVSDYTRQYRRVPSRVFIGAETISPGQFLHALALAELARRESEPARRFPLPAKCELEPAREVAQDTPNLFGGWIIHPEGFRAPKILEVARLQTWTLKPARLAGSK